MCSTYAVTNAESPGPRPSLSSSSSVTDPDEFSIFNILVLGRGRRRRLYGTSVASSAGGDLSGTVTVEL